MKSLSENQQLKRVMIASLAGMAIASLVLLAASLARLEFKPAQLFFAPDEPQRLLFELKGIVRNIASMSPGEALLLAAGFILIMVFLLLMLSPDARKRLLKTIFRMGLTAWAIFYALAKIQPQGELEIEAPGSVIADGLDILATPPAYTPPVIPPSLLFLVSFTIFLLGIGVVVLIFRALRPTRPALHNLRRVARGTLGELSSGRNWEDSVISCYIRMGAAVSEKRGLSRQNAMTPAEFAHRLEQAGLPSNPVRRLTRLFEKARYSRHTSSEEDLREAVACMTSILTSIGDEA
jgi:hypothetical protein